MGAGLEVVVVGASLATSAVGLCAAPTCLTASLWQCDCPSHRRRTDLSCSSLAILLQAVRSPRDVSPKITKSLKLFSDKEFSVSFSKVVSWLFHNINSSFCIGQYLMPLSLCWLTHGMWVQTVGTYFCALLHVIVDDDAHDPCCRWGSGPLGTAFPYISNCVLCMT